MTWTLALLGSLVFVELLIRSRIDHPAKKLLSTASKASRVLASSRISEHWKEKVLLRYAADLARNSLDVMGRLLLAGLPVLAAGYLLQFVHADILAFFSTLPGLALCSVAGVFYARVRTQNLGAEQQNAYGFWSRCLHTLALGSRAVAETTFDIECARHGKQALNWSEQEMPAPVFICGLARAGTTLHMNLLYETGSFFSLTYRDMPFVLAPNMWSALRGMDKGYSGSQKPPGRERAHGDGVKSSVDSPEALEEVFWRMRYGDQYIQSDRLIPAVPDASTIAAYRKFVALIGYRYRDESSDNSPGYLCKNNNHILRLPYLEQSFPNATVVIPLRHPLAQAYSLKQQHEHFQRVHAAEPFARRYMRWLVHHEFGSDHRPFVLNGDAGPQYSPATLNYWLALWVEVYSHVLKQAGASGMNYLFSSYEGLCADPVTAWGGLKAGLDRDIGQLPNISIRAVSPLGEHKNKLDNAVDTTLLRSAESLHAQLLGK